MTDHDTRLTEYGEEKMLGDNQGGFRIMYKTILITGGAGFIGSNYVNYHAQKYPHDRIVVLDNLADQDPDQDRYASSLKNLENWRLTRKFGTVIIGDIADEEVIDKVFSEHKFDTVINFAACADKSIEQPTIFVKTNILGTQNLLAQCNKRYIQFHQVSTAEVYGDLGFNSSDLFTENSPIQPNCPYAASKAAADLLVLSYFHTYNLPVTISRSGNNYGPNQTPEKLIPKFLQLAARNDALPLMGSGLHIRDWIYVEDHCRAIDKIIQVGRRGEVYNVGARNEQTNLSIAIKILEYLDKPLSLIHRVKDRLAHDERSATDPSKLESLGWKPQDSFSSNFDKTLKYYYNTAHEKTQVP